MYTTPSFLRRLSALFLPIPIPYFPYCRCAGLRGCRDLIELFQHHRQQLPDARRQVRSHVLSVQKKKFKKENFHFISFHFMTRLEKLAFVAAT